MRSRAAVLWAVGEDWKVEDVELDPPKAGEVLVKMGAAGLCHSDEHLVTGDLGVTPEMIELGVPPMVPVVGGHEGAGVVVDVGAGVKGVAPGDHVAASFVPACGQCRWCVTGRSALCDLGMSTFGPGMITDGTHRLHVGGQDINTMAKLGTFAEHMVVSEASLVKIDPHVGLSVAALVSCGVATGWGSAVHRAEVAPGETVVVVGVGGIGMNAVQGARMAGAKYVVAVDTAEFKRKSALDFGATHVAESMAEALPLVVELTAGQLAEKVIMAPSVMYGDLLAGGMALTGKDGTLVVTAVAPMAQMDVSLSLFELAMWNKQIKGVIFGSGNPRFDIPNLLSLYSAGQLKLDELITRTYSLDQINEGYQDMRDGKNIRGVIVFD